MYETYNQVVFLFRGVNPRNSELYSEGPNIQLSEYNSELHYQLPMKAFDNLLAKNKFLILDGAIATELERKGADLNDPLWSAKVLLDQPSLILQTHLDYIKAGADIITTTTYQATFEGLAKKGLSQKKAEEIFNLAVELAGGAREIFFKNPKNKRPVLIAGSIGPYGAFLADGSEYTGQYDIDKNQLKSFHRKRLAFLTKTKIDLLIFETFPNLKEIEAISELLSDLKTPYPVLFSLSCKNASELADGSSISAAAKIATRTDQVKAIGINCIRPNLVAPVLATISKSVQTPLMAYPNNGDKWNAAQKCWIENKLENASETHWKEWLEKGAKVIGGCCRTTPSTIERLWKFRASFTNKR